MNKIKYFLRRKLAYYMRDVNERYLSTRMTEGYQNESGFYAAQAKFSNTTYINHPEIVTVGDKVRVGHFTILDGTGGLEIEEGCHIGSWVGIFTPSPYCGLMFRRRFGLRSSAG